MNRITWYKNRVALVGDYLERLGLDGLLSESGKLRADMDRFQQRLISENVEPNREWDNDPLGLFEFADYYGQFTKTNATRDGPREVLWDREYRAQKEEDREVLGEDQYYDYDTDIDEERIDRISDRARPIFPPYKTAVLCNLTKRQFVRSEMVLKFQWRDPEEKLIDTRSVPYTGLFPRPELHELYPDHLTLGATVFFLTIITDDWGFNLRFVEKEDPVGRGPGLVMGRWAGDCLAVVEPDEVEEDMLDISEEVVAMVRRFVEA
ncbi:hypothetical protein PENSPDRAFT_41573 [Peniophora sp. CONT]|nr:hypothetical protein PENSPDRAFT_41573 [Peniophora sp. CONT]